MANDITVFHDQVRAALGNIQPDGFTFFYVKRGVRAFYPLIVGVAPTEVGDILHHALEAKGVPNHVKVAKVSSLPDNASMLIRPGKPGESEMADAVVVN